MPGRYPWGRWPLNMQALVPVMTMAAGPFSQGLIAPQLGWLEGAVLSEAALSRHVGTIVTGRLALSVTFASHSTARS